MKMILIKSFSDQVEKDVKEALTNLKELGENVPEFKDYEDGDEGKIIVCIKDKLTLEAAQFISNHLDNDIGIIKSDNRIEDVDGILTKVRAELSPWHPHNLPGFMDLVGIE